MLLKKLLFILFISLSIFSQFCLADTIDTQLSRDKIALGDTLSISYTLTSNTYKGSPDFSVLEKDFQIISRNYGKAVVVVNGDMKTQYFWHLGVQAKQAGDFTIPAIQFGDTQSSPRIMHVDQEPTPTTSDSKNAHAFIEAGVSNPSPYVQSQVLYTIKLFYQTQLTDPRMEIPQIKDVTFFQIGDSQNYQTSIKGNTYNVVEMNFAFFPKKTGEFNIPPAHFRATSYEVNNNAQDAAFYFEEPKQIVLATKPFTLQVLSAPAAYQGSTWLPAKKVTINEDWTSNPLQWETGNPVTRFIVVEAEGLRADQIPDLTIEKIPGVNMYIDTPRRQNRMQHNTMIGVMEQKVTYLPNNATTLNIPGIKLNWWNTGTNSQAIAQSNPIAVQVQGNAANNNLQDKNKSITASSNAKAGVKQAARGNTNPFYLSIWFWLSILLLAGWMFTLWLIWRKKSNTFAAQTEKQHAPEEVTPVLSETAFKYACEEGDAATAQQYLLSWSKEHWSEIPHNLEKLCELVKDEQFKQTIMELEHAIYSRKAGQWNGRSLFSAYQSIQPQRKLLRSLFGKKKRLPRQHVDPLPPLNP